MLTRFHASKVSAERLTHWTPATNGADSVQDVLEELWFAFGDADHDPEIREASGGSGFGVSLEEKGVTDTIWCQATVCADTKGACVAELQLQVVVILVDLTPTLVWEL